MKTFIIAIAAVLVTSMAHAASPVHGTCGPTFQKIKYLGGTSLGQDRCKDGLVTHIRTNPLLCRCQHTCDWDDGSRRTTCSPCPGTQNYYEDELHLIENVHTPTEMTVELGGEILFTRKYINHVGV